MTALSGPDPTPIVSVEDLVRYFRSGAKPVSAWRIGIEQEKIAVFSDGGVVPFDGAVGIEALLGRLAAATDGFSAMREEGRLLALRGNRETVTVEPGGQLEFSGPALATAIDCRDSLVRHLGDVTPVAGAMGIKFLGVGLRPFGGLDDIPWLPKRRYAVMRAYLPTRGRLGPDMMKRTATVQANFDFDGEQTAVEKVRTAFGVTSIVTALFAASPISGGRPNGYRSERAAIWLDTDEDRCGLLPFVFEDGFGFRDYVEWALDVPMFFVVRAGDYTPAGGMTFRRFLAEGWVGPHGPAHATVGDWEVHLSTLFPEVRLKKYIEVRGADAGPLAMAVGLAALWRGLLEDAAARTAAWQLVRAAGMDEREALRREVPRAGMRARFRDRPVRELAVELCRIARAGLGRLPGGAGDATLLDPVEERALTGRDPGEDMLDDFQACAGDPAALCRRWELGVDPTRR